MHGLLREEQITHIYREGKDTDLSQIEVIRTGKSREIQMASIAQRLFLASLM